jgi:toxin YoeB
MNYRLDYTDDALEDIAAHKKSDVQSYNKIKTLIQELHEHPRTGTGKPEALKHKEFAGCWSRRITGKNRLIYQIKDKEVLVLVIAATGHYKDK